MNPEQLRASLPTPAAQRLPNWPQRLGALVLARRTTPWRLGQLDCCLWAADAVQATTGVDPAAPLRGTYALPGQAMAVLRAVGGLRGAAGLMGRPMAATTQAVEGDLGLVRHGGRPLLAVCGGQHWLVVSTQGLLAMPWGSAEMVWGVGRA